MGKLMQSYHPMNIQSDIQKEQNEKKINKTTLDYSSTGELVLEDAEKEKYNNQDVTKNAYQNQLDAETGKKSKKRRKRHPIKRDDLVYAKTGKPAPPGAEKSKGRSKNPTFITRYAYERRNEFVYAETGQPVPPNAETRIDPEGREIITRNAYKQRKNKFVTLVYAETGQPAPPNAETGIDPEGREIITINAYKQRKNKFVILVYAETGKLAPPDAEKGIDSDGREIITKHAYIQRNMTRLVYAKTGQPAPPGAKKSSGRGKNKEFITRYTYERRNELVYAESGEPAPPNAEKGIDSEGREILTKTAYQQRKNRCLSLVYAETGEPAPPDVKKGYDLDSIEIITKNAYRKRNMALLVYAETGQPAPQNSKKGIDTDGRKIITKNAYILRKGRLEDLVYAETGEPAPQNSKKGIDTDGRKIIDRVTYNNRKRKNNPNLEQEKKQNGNKQLKRQRKNEGLKKGSKLAQENSQENKIENNETKTFTFGIANKYLAGYKIKRLPIPSAENYQKITYEQIISLIPLKNLKTDSKSSAMQIVDVEISNKYMHATLSFRSKNLLPDSTQAVTYIFAGRGLDALIPMASVHSRIILVIPASQYESLKNVSENVDILIIKELKSVSHGNFTDLKLPNPRRLAAFLFSYHLKLKTCLMMDDNIKDIKLKEGTKNWQDFYNQLVEKNDKNKGLWVSVPTEFYKKKNIFNKLGSKLFMFNMEAIRNKLQIHQMFFFLPPAGCANWWGEDYFISAMLLEIFSQSVAKSNNILPETEFCLTRSKKIKNTCLNVLDVGGSSKAKIYLEKNLMNEIEIKNLEEKESTWISNALKKIQEEIIANEKSYKKHEEKINQSNLIESHAMAQNLKITPANIHEVKENELLSSDDIFNLLKKNIALHLNELEKVLRKHQIDALRALEKHDFRKGLFSQATGTGKTFLEIAIAFLIHLLGLKKPIIFVIPTITLLHQFYKDFLDVIKLFKKINILPIDEAHVVKCSSMQQDIHWDLLSHDSLTNKNLVFLFCKESFLKSYKKLQLNPAILMIDESHVLSLNDQKNILDHFQDKTLIYFFTATPKRTIQPFPIIFNYTRKQAVEDGILVPLFLDSFKENYSEENLKKLLTILPQFLKTYLHPSGLRLNQMKGIIYLPPGHPLTEIKEHLEKNDISCYVIHSQEKKVQTIVKNFKKDTKPTVGLAVGMLGFGFDDERIDYVIIANSAKNKTLVAQNSGRAVRRDPRNPEKTALVITFNNPCVDSLELSQENRDRNGFLFMRSNYEAQNRQILSLERFEFAKKTENTVSSSFHPRMFAKEDLSEEKKSIIKIAALMEKLRKLESDLNKLLSLNTKPFTANSIVFNSIFNKPTSPWNGFSIEKQKEHRMALVMEDIKSIKEQLEKFGVPREHLYRESYLPPNDIAVQITYENI